MRYLVIYIWVNVHHDAMQSVCDAKPCLLPPYISEPIQASATPVIRPSGLPFFQGRRMAASAVRGIYNGL